jgi:SagB-type dehydrogenase family enzyme
MRQFGQMTPMQPRARMTTLYRRSPNLVFYWSGKKLVLENYYARSKVRASPLVFQLLSFFDSWRRAETIENHFPQFSAAALRAGLSVLVHHGLLQRSDRPDEAVVPQAMDSWADWNPAAGYLHFSTKDVHYVSDLDLLLQRRRARAKTRPMPAPVKRYPGAKRTALPTPRHSGEFPQVLLARRTWRRFSSESVEFSALSTLLGLSFGVHWWVDLPGLGRLALKTSPSAGALHPIETYVVARRVTNLPPGLYHYAADRHCLELLKRGASSRQVVRYLAGQKWFGRTAALVLMTAVFRRPQWKYQSPRAYRAVLIDAGHVCQTFCLVATWLGLAPFCTMALVDSRIEADLGIDGVSESVLYAAGVGTLPRGLKWAPWPTHFHGTRHPNSSFT